MTLPETTEIQESWRLYDSKENAVIKSELLPRVSGWSSPVSEIIKGAERMLKFGLHDREELAPEQWYTQRCVLLGDAAHPTSPHLGQGANQALYNRTIFTILYPKH